MRILVSIAVIVLISLSHAVPAYAVCGDETLCMNPPGPPNGCITYKDYCHAVPPAGTQDDPGYSITLEHISLLQLANIQKLLGLESNKPPQPK